MPWALLARRPPLPRSPHALRQPHCLAGAISHDLQGGRTRLHAALTQASAKGHAQAKGPPPNRITAQPSHRHACPDHHWPPPPPQSQQPAYSTSVSAAGQQVPHPLVTTVASTCPDQSTVPLPLGPPPAHTRQQQHYHPPPHPSQVQVPAPHCRPPLGHGRGVGCPPHAAVRPGDRNALIFTLRGKDSGGRAPSRYRMVTADLHRTTLYGEEMVS